MQQQKQEALPVPSPALPPSPAASSYDSFHQSARMMFNFAQALSAIVLAGREATRLAGYTSRVTRLERLIDDLERDEARSTASEFLEKKDVIELQGVPIVAPVVGEEGGKKGGREEGGRRRRRR
ncbi:atp-binding cassette sub-family d member 3 isoform a, partial [Nannochloropsis gaditana]